VYPVQTGCGSLLRESGTVAVFLFFFGLILPILTDIPNFYLPNFFNPQGLSYEWSCVVFGGSIDIACRSNVNGSAIAIPSTVDVSLAAGELAASDFPYRFTVLVSKGTRSPASFTIPVTVKSIALPAMALTATTIDGGRQLSDGTVYLNSNGKITF
jgi:hypothetical protein